MDDASFSANIANFLSEWRPFLVPFLVAILTPLGIKIWKAIERHDERKRLRYEAKRAARLEQKAARKAVKEAAKGDHHTSIFIHTPPRLGHDGSCQERSNESAARTSEPR